MSNAYQKGLQALRRAYGPQVRVSPMLHSSLSFQRVRVRVGLRTLGTGKTALAAVQDALRTLEASR